jgi:hypothetical protein
VSVSSGAARYRSRHPQSGSIAEPPTVDSAGSKRPKPGVNAGRDAYQNGNRRLKLKEDDQAAIRRGMAAIGMLEDYELTQLRRRAEKVLDEMDRLENGTQL